MMTGCSRCGTSWTSMGLPMCPICGDRVPDPAPSVEVAPTVRREASGPAAEPQPSAGRDTAVLEAEAPEPEPVPPPPSLGETIVLKSVPVDMALRPEPPVRERLAAEPRPLRPPEPAPVDASCVLAAPPRTLSDFKLPSPARPLNGPVVLGSLAVAAALLPIFTAAFEGNRIFGILGFCLSGFLLPFPPVAWINGLGAERRRREQRLRVERRVLVGRLLGQAATLLLIAEGAFGLLFVAAMRLSGKFPATFWAP